MRRYKIVRGKVHLDRYLVYYKYRWWPFWFEIPGGSRHSVDDAERAAQDHADDYYTRRYFLKQKRLVKDLGNLNRRLRPPPNI